MYSQTMPLRTAVLRPTLHLLSASAVLLLTLAAGCEDTLVPAIEEARLTRDGEPDEGQRDAQHDQCLFAMLYEVEGDLFRFKGGSAQVIDPEGGGGGGGLGGGGPGPGPQQLGIAQELYGYDGYARLLWGDQVVAELTIDKAFLQAGRVEVLAHDAPTGVRFEYHLYTQPDCSEPWTTPQVLTRQEVEAREK